jgi:hypothetical protein
MHVFTPEKEEILNTLEGGLPIVQYRTCTKLT